MKPLICPQCGGKITEYAPWQNFAVCGYCETKFVIEREKPAAIAQPVYEPLKTSSLSPNVFVGIVAAACLVIGGIFLIAILTNRKDAKPDYPVYNPPRYSTPAPAFSPAPTPNPNLLEFGGKGTGNGLFQEAGAIAVDSKGRIYVADDSLRVQQFDEKGIFLKLWQIPSQTKHYRRARTIQKIAVDDQDRLYVLVGGVVQMWEQNTTDLPETSFHAAPDFIVDFALRSDGGLLLVPADDDIETLIYTNRAGRVTRRVRGFHTETADASMSPHEVGLAAIRLAVDGAGNLYVADTGNHRVAIYLANNRPTAAPLTLTPASPTTLDNLVGTYSYQDTDGDVQGGTEVRGPAFPSRQTVPPPLTSENPCEPRRNRRSPRWRASCCWPRKPPPPRPRSPAASWGSPTATP